MSIFQLFIIKVKSFLKLKDEEQFDKTIGILLYHLATKAKAQIKNRFPVLIENICNKNIASEAQLDGETVVSKRRHFIIIIFI